MNKLTNLSFWIITFVVLVALFSGSLGSWLLSFYFVTFLLPVIIGTSLYFSEHLVPRFLLTDRYGEFALHFFYLMVVSIYAELLVMMISFILLADYSIENLGEYASDIRLLALIMYLVVFGYGFIGAFSRLKMREVELEKMTSEKPNEESTIVVTINRKKVPVRISDIRLVESLSDYIKIHTDKSVLIVRESISNLEAELPEFIRIHRSFLINKNHVESYSNEKVTIVNQELTLGRKFKKDALEALNSI